MITAVVIAVVPEAVISVSVWGFIASLQQGSWQCAIAAVCALPLQGFSYQVHAENRCPPYEDRRTPHHVLWHNPYNND